jgi:hypothetical protein
MANERPTVLGFPVIDRLVIYLGVPALFVLVGSALPFVARWMLGWGTALPLRPAFSVVGAIDGGWKVAVNVAIWLVLGLIVAFAAKNESAVVTLTNDRAHFGLGDKATDVARADVAAVFTEGKRLVVLDHESRQVFRERTQASRQVLAAAFREHGYPWQDSDPYDALFRPWTPGAADLPSEVDSVLTARESALKKKAAKEAGELRDVAQKLGYVVRDQGTRQDWRPLVRS